MVKISIILDFKKKMIIGTGYPQFVSTRLKYIVSTYVHTIGFYF